MLGAIGRSRRAVETAIAGWAALLREDARFDVLGPAPYAVARVNDEWRYRLAVRDQRSGWLRAALRERIIPLAAAAAGVRLTVAIDA